jgi:acyl carrier protein
MQQSILQNEESQFPIADEPAPPQELATLHARPALTTPYVAPDSEIERTIAALWQELLGIERPGIHDDFFELGGHSLMATQLMTRLRDVFLIEIPMQSIFAKPTIAGLAETAEALFVAHLEQLSDEEAERFMATIFHNHDA